MALKLFKIFASLRLTLALLGGSMLLIFLGTLDQVHYGIHEVQKRYFESLWVVWQYPGHWALGEILSRVRLVLPGGYLIGGLLLINLICAHFRYFKWHPKKIGISIIHSGILLLIISGFATSMYQQESQMWLDLGKPINFSENVRTNELVIIDKSSETTDTVISIPETLLKKQKIFEPEALPFSLKVMDYYPNASLALKSQNPNVQGSAPQLATQGAGIKMDLLVYPQAVTYKENEINTATAYIALEDDQGLIGTWLVSNVMDGRFPAQKFEHRGKPYEIALRFKRTYLPYTLTLTHFTHEKYPGTEIPKHFASEIILNDPSKNAQRNTIIYMNNPLRYEGSTFYQASFAPGETASMLQVVQNPTRLLPYLAVWIVGLGLLVQFLSHLVSFKRKA